MRNVKVDDYVIVADPNGIRGKWTTGRIVQVFPGEDEGNMIGIDWLKGAVSRYFLLFFPVFFFYEL